MPNCMGSGPPAGDGTRPARRRSSDGGGLQVVVPPRDELVGRHVHDHVRFLEHGVAHERLVALRSRLHLDEDHLVVDPPEPVRAGSRPFVTVISTTTSPIRGCLLGMNGRTLSIAAPPCNAWSR